MTNIIERQRDPLKTGMSLADFEAYCKEAGKIAFCFEGEDQDEYAEWMRIRIVMPPPEIFVNLGVVSFSDGHGGKIVLSGVERIVMIRDKISRINIVRFECRRLGVLRSFSFLVVGQKNF